MSLREALSCPLSNLSLFAWLLEVALDGRENLGCSPTHTFGENTETAGPGR